MNLDFFKKEKISKMKERDKDSVSALNVVIDKIMHLTIEKRAKGEELSEADILTVLKKSEKELVEEKEEFEKAGANYVEKVKSLERQVEVVRSYLPQMMSKEAIKEVILGLEDKSVGAVMRHFKTNFAGKCDMKEVGEVLRSL